MITKTARINEFMFRWSDDGQPRGAHVVDREEIRDGEIVVASRFLDPRPVVVADAPALAEISANINAAALAETAALAAQVAALTIERDTAVADLVTRTAERDALQAQIEAAAATDAGSVDALALELVLSQQGLLPAVLAYVESQGEQVQVYWRRVRVMRRASPLIEAARVALGLTNEQVDALFAAAAQVVT